MTPPQLGHFFICLLHGGYRPGIQIRIKLIGGGVVGCQFEIGVSHIGIMIGITDLRDAVAVRDIVVDR